MKSQSLSKIYDILSSSRTKEVYGADLHRMPAQSYHTAVFDFLANVFCSKEATYLIFTDGRPKVFLNTATNQLDEKGIDACICEYLSANSFNFRFLSTTEVLGLEASDLHASFENVEKLSKFLADFDFVSKQTIVTVLGSGSLVDIVKHAMHLLEMPNDFVVVPTALTVTAFTSSFAVLEKSGAKKTYPSRDVSACYWLEPLLSHAPVSLTAAGYGDLLARFVAYGDWYLASVLGFAQNYQPHSFLIMEQFSDNLKHLAAEIGQMRTTGVLSASSTRSLTEVLSMAGLVMTLSKETTPLSGYEHVISHALDFLRLSSHRPLVLHGEQVALACLASAHAFDWLISQDKILVDEFRTWPIQQGRSACVSLIRGAPFFGEQEAFLSAKERVQKVEQIKAQIDLAEAHFVSEYEKKHYQWSQAKPALADWAKNWPCIAKELRRLTLPASEMELLLKSSGLPLSPEETTPGTTALELRFAVRFSPFVRARWCLGDVLYWMDFDPALVSGI